MSVLREHGVSYHTYNYWRKKLFSESEPHQIAPISINEPSTGAVFNATFTEVEASGVVLAFPNGLRAHFGRGSESVLIELLNKSLSHVLP